MTTQIKSTDLEYGGLIDAFLAAPLRANLGKPGVLVDALTEIVVGSSQSRFGPRPSPEVLVTIRNVLRTLTERQLPIRILSPWGTMKPVKSHGLDVAEVAAMIRMRTLQEEVCAVYEPGIEWVVAVESSGGTYNRKLEIEADPGVREAVWKYINSLSPLVQALGMGGFTVVQLEHVMPGAERFEAEADRLAGILFQHLWTNAPLTLAEDLGWRGEIAPEMRDFYLRSYEKHRPRLSPRDHLQTLARYLAAANTRYRLNMKAPAGWGQDYLQVNFPPPVPGVPDHLAARRLFYRTMPAKHTHNHVPPWRGKGYLCITGGQHVQFKMTSWHQIPEDLVANAVEVTGNGASVTVEADYLLRDR
jgi:hypothetical protein